MIKKHRLAIFLIVVMLAASALACQAGGAKPTPTPTQPPPSATTPPTKTPVLPTNTPAPTATQPPPTATTAPTNTPLPTATNTSEPRATSTTESQVVTFPEAINVIDVNGFVNSDGVHFISGLVRNDTQRQVTSVEVEVELRDANENSLYKEVTSVMLYYLAPGDTSPFTLYVYEDLKGVEKVVGAVVGNSTSDFKRADLEFSESVVTGDETSGLYVTGEVTNSGSEPVDISNLAVAFFDKSGKIISAGNYGARVDYLAPGKTGSYRVDVPVPEGYLSEMVDYVIYPDVVTTYEADSYNLTLYDDKNFTYSDSLDYFHLVGEITNNDSVNLNVYLLATIYDSEKRVVDVASASLPVYSIAPGETLPFDFTFWGPLNYVAGTLDKASTYVIEVDWSWTWETTTELIELTTADDTNSLSDRTLTFTGNVVNGSGSAVDGATVIVAIYDKESGQILAVDSGYIFDEIPNGKNAKYEVYVDVPADFNLDTSEYVITVKAEKK